MAIGNSTDRFNGVIASLAVKVRCVVGVEVDVPTLDGITNPYSGVNIADGDRVLLTAQTDPIENGIWDARIDGAWTRAADWDGNRDVEKGSTVWAGQQTGDDKLWQCQTAGIILPGSTAVSITELLNPENIGLGGITVEDEGTPLATNADTLDFVGAGVDATGVGTTKTITIPGADGGFQGLGLWRYRTATGSNPSAGQMQFNNTTIESATEMYVNETNDGSTDMTAFLDLIVADDLIYVQVQVDSTQFVAVQVGTPSKATGVYTFPIQLVEAQGTAPSNNTTVAIVASSSGASGGGGGVTVEDEGTPLVTIADTLDFVGAGVTASGAGGTKTISIPGGGGGGVVVEDEGTPLATTADTLNFVGAGVTATGAGLTKTITIPGGGADPEKLVDPSANDAVVAQGGGTVGIRSIGNTDAENRDLEWQHQDGTTRFSIGQEFSTAMIFRHHITGEPMIFRVGVGGGNRDRLRLDGNQSTGGVLIYAAASSVKLETFPEGAKVRNGCLFIQQQAAQEANQSGFGQLFVDSADDALHYITEAGVDFDLTAGGGGGMVTGISKNSGANVNAANRSVLNFIEGSNITLTIADDAGGDEVDITIAAAGGGGGMVTGVSLNGGANINAADRSVLNFIEGSSKLDLVITDDAGGDEVDISVDVVEANIDHDALTNFLAAEHIDWAVTGAENIHADRLPAPGQTFTMVTPISISFGGDDSWATISDATLAAAGATHALIKCYASIAPTASALATQVIHLRETGSAIAKATSNRAVEARAEDSSGLGAGSDTNDAWVELNANEDFDILQDQTGTGTSINQAWIIGYMA